MAFEVAFRFKDPETVRKVKHAICSLSQTHSLIRGTDILENVQKAIALPVNPNLLYDLIEGEVIISKYPSKCIEDYYFEMNVDAVDNYFEKEFFAAEVVQKYESLKSSKDHLGISYAVTIPIEYTNIAEGFEEIEPALVRLAAEAEKDLWIVNPFFDEYGAQRLMNSMLGAAKNGVKVWILGRQIGRASGNGINEAVQKIALAFIEENLEKLIEIRDFYRQDGQGRQLYGLHTKMMIADEDMAYIGSANLTKHSLRSNFEVGVILRGAEVSPLAALTKNLWEEGEAVDLNELADL